MSEIESLVTLAETTVDRVYAAGSVPSTPGYPYAVLALSRMAPDTRTLNGRGNNPRRFTAQVFGKNAESVEDIADLLLTTFDATYLDDFDGEPQCRVEVITPPYRDPDDRGVLNITQTYRF